MILTLLGVALVPVFLVSAIIYLISQSSLRNQQLNQLDAIASIQQARIRNLIGQNNVTLASFTSRSTMRTVLDHYNQTGNSADRLQIQQSLTSAQAGSMSIRSISVLAPSGVVVASTQPDTVGRNLANQDYFAPGRAANNVTDYIVRGTDGKLTLDMVGPLRLGDRLIGVAVIESDMQSFLDLAMDYTGLGSTGETVIVAHSKPGQAVYLLPLRFDPQAALQRSAIQPRNSNPVVSSLIKHQSTSGTTTDYRGHTVLAATRYIPQADWGLEVKIDEAEAYQPLTQLSNLLLGATFMLSVVIIFVAFYLARRLNEPILAVAMTADAIRAGNLAARAHAHTKDEIGQLATTFNAMAENIEKVDQMKSEFVLLTSHQLRTPATAVKGFISMLLDDFAGPMSPKQKDLAKAAYAENERQISVINSILDVARLEAGELELVRSNHDVAQIVDDSAKGQAPLLADRNQKITVVKPPKPVVLWVDRTKLRLVVDNLIHNAIKYSPKGTQITATVKTSSAHTTIEIRDQGIGIAERDQKRLFKRFSRIPGPNTANVQGAGLGLYLAEKLVMMHGGTITVHSKEGVGTSFIITLPNNNQGGN